MAVTQPVRYSNQRKLLSRRVVVMLGLTWSVSVAVSLPIAIGMNYTHRRRTHTPSMCVFYNADFIIGSSLASFYVPCLVMVAIYYRIFRALRHRTRHNAPRFGPLHANASAAAATLCSLPARAALPGRFRTVGGFLEAPAKIELRVFAEDDLTFSSVPCCESMANSDVESTSSPSSTQQTTSAARGGMVRRAFFVQTFPSPAGLVQHVIDSMAGPMGEVSGGFHGERTMEGVSAGFHRDRKVEEVSTGFHTDIAMEGVSAGVCEDRTLKRMSTSFHGHTTTEGVSAGFHGDRSSSPLQGCQGSTMRANKVQTSFLARNSSHDRRVGQRVTLSSRGKPVTERSRSRSSPSKSRSGRHVTTKSTRRQERKVTKTLVVVLGG